MTMHTVITLHLFATALVAFPVVDECNWTIVCYSQSYPGTRVVAYSKTLGTVFDDCGFSSRTRHQPLISLICPWPLATSPLE